MTRIGIVGRADYGGIAAQTLAVARALGGVDVALVANLGDKSRGRFDHRAWRALARERRICDWPATNEDATWLLDRCDVVYMPECPLWLRDDKPTFSFPKNAAEMGVKVVIHVNPELWRPEYEPVTKILPTSWEADRHSGTPVVPVPIDRKRYPYTRRTEARAFFHLGAPAMDDRAGTNLVKEALPHVRSKIYLYTRGVHVTANGAVAKHPIQEKIGNVNVVHLPPEHDHKRVMPTLADVLISPRRYGGLSLPYLEAASLGMPIVALDLPPQNEWLPNESKIPARGCYSCSMIGGHFPVWDGKAEELAARIDLLANEPDVVDGLSCEMHRFAGSQTWGYVHPRWAAALGVEQATDGRTEP